MSGKTWISTFQGSGIFLESMTVESDLVCLNWSSATNRLITSKDHASVQLNNGHLDARGVYTSTFSTFALCGFVRAQQLEMVNSVLGVFRSGREVYGCRVGINMAWLTSSVEEVASGVKYN